MNLVGSRWIPEARMHSRPTAGMTNLVSFRELGE
jgi:hypothetical protein